MERREKRRREERREEKSNFTYHTRLWNFT
jgi:hypothetical protein